MPQGRQDSYRPGHSGHATEETRRAPSSQVKVLTCRARPGANVAALCQRRGAATHLQRYCVFLVGCEYERGRCGLSQNLSHTLTHRARGAGDGSIGNAWSVGIVEAGITFQKGSASSASCMSAARQAANGCRRSTSCFTVGRGCRWAWHGGLEAGAAVEQSLGFSRWCRRADRVRWQLGRCRPRRPTRLRNPGWGRRRQ